MEEFIANCGRWIDLPALIYPDHKSIRILIKLHQNSLKFGYLIIVLDGKVHCVVQLTKLISSSSDENTITILIPENTIKIIKVELENFLVANLINTQINLCSFLSDYDNCINNDFNIPFFLSYSLPINSVEIKNPTFPLFPIQYFPESMKTFLNRNQTLNSGYFLQKSQVKISFLTWNVEQKVPTEWTSKEISFIFASGSEVVYIVLEEIDFSAKAILLGGSDLRQEWTNRLCDAASWYNYQAIYFDQLGGVFTIAFKNSDSKHKISVENLFSMRLGVNGLAANKSCCVSRLTIDNTKMCVIGAHLEAHTESLEERNFQFKTILSKIDQNIDDYTVVFGDLNYRIDLPYHDTLNLIKVKDYQKLLQNDQLKNIMRTDEVIGKFKEGEINFNPTFKFDENCNTYDTSSKLRTPSWTDRVLVRTSKPKLWTGLNDDLYFESSALPVVCCNNRVKLSGKMEHLDPDYPSEPVCAKYRSYDVQFSDHRPVVADYIFDIVSTDEKRFKLYKYEENKHIDSIYELNQLKIVAKPNDLILKVGEPQKFTIYNQYISFGRWELGVVPDFIHITPNSGILAHKMIELTIVADKPIETPEICSINAERGSPAFFSVSTK